MKTSFSRVVALGVLVAVSPVWAQPDTTLPAVVLPEPKEADFDRAENSADALALIGAFYNKLTRAESYRGRLITVTTITDKGKVLSTKTAEIEASCIGDKGIQGAFKREASQFIVTTVSNGKTTVEKFRRVDDGVKNHRFNETKNIWSERVHEEGDTSEMFDVTEAAWTFALAMFGAKREFETETWDVGGQEQIVVQDKLKNQYTFDAETGDLLIWNHTVSLGGGYRVQVETRWLQHGFDVLLADSLFKWKAPAGAKKVAPESMDFGAYLNAP